MFSVLGFWVCFCQSLVKALLGGVSFSHSIEGVSASVVDGFGLMFFVLRAFYAISCIRVTIQKCA